MGEFGLGRLRSVGARRSSWGLLRSVESGYVKVWRSRQVDLREAWACWVVVRYVEAVTGGAGAFSLVKVRLV